MTRLKVDNKQKKGFTIIEVVLVLAIAGLIMMMVFIALPALQRSQRDTQRRNDMARLVTAVQNYQANHRNKVPSSDAFGENGTFVADYLLTNGDSFDDPSTGETYTFTGFDDLASTETTSSSSGSGSGSSSSSSDDSDGTGVITVYYGAKCGTSEENGGAEKSKGSNNMAFVIKLEGAGYYCTNN